MYTPNQLLQLVNDALPQVTEGRTPLSLYAPISYVLAMGGKRIRPVLTLLAYQLYKDRPEDILPQALALETYHNYTLLHDDLMDKAEMRRGHQTVHCKWDDNTAILSGDSMLVMAYQLMAQGEQENLQEIIQLFTRTALEIGEGQQFDMDFETRMNVREEEYIEMIRLKTSVLLACSLQVGARLGGASEADARALYHFGEQWGLAFQLQDDYLDVYGDPKVFGKTIGGDIMSNKKTFMLINALQRANATQRQELMRWIEAPNPQREEKVEAVTALYNEIGVGELAQQRILHYFQMANQHLETVKVEETRKQVLHDYVLGMIDRNR